MESWQSHLNAAQENPAATPAVEEALKQMGRPEERESSIDELLEEAASEHAAVTKEVESKVGEIRGRIEDQIRHQAETQTEFLYEPALLKGAITEAVDGVIEHSDFQKMGLAAVRDEITRRMQDAFRIAVEEKMKTSNDEDEANRLEKLLNGLDKLNPAEEADRQAA